MSKYNIGDKILVEAYIKEIKEQDGEVYYTIENDNWYHHVHITENKIKGLSNK